jgi:2-dehydropantoate 2-reductase
MKIVVLGAGAIGSLYASRLAGRHDVTLVARPAHAAAIARDGLRIVGRETGVYPVHAVTSVDRAPDAELYLLTTKVTANAAMAEALARRLRGGATVLCVQNGLGGDEIVRAALGERAVVLRAVTQFGAIFQAPGIIDYKVQGDTVIERGRGSEEVAALLTASGLDARVTDRIDQEVWRKLVFNCVINPITAIVGVEVGGIADSRLDGLKQLVIDECVAVARASGVELDVDFMTALREVFGPSRNIASMRQDLMRGKPTEIDYMNGAVVARGQRLGIPCPVNAALASIIKAMERAASRGEV